MKWDGHYVPFHPECYPSPVQPEPKELARYTTWLDTVPDMTLWTRVGLWFTHP